MGTKLQATTINFDQGAATGLTNFGNPTLSISGLGYPSLATMDMDVYQMAGGLVVGWAKPVNNSVYPRFTPVDFSGNIIPYSAAIQYNYGTSYGDGGFTNETGYYNFGIPVYNTGNTANIKFIIEGGGYGWTTFDVSPCVSIRSIYQYANYTVHRIDAITLGTGAANSNTDIRKIQLSFSSGNFYGGCTPRIFAQ